MKKFLSMLLALSVVFTFTFGSASSAFAATGDYTAAKAQALNEAKAVAEKVVSDNYEDAMKQVKDTDLGYNDGADNKDKRVAAWDKVDVKGQLAEFIAEKFAAEAKTFAKYAAGKSAAEYATALFATENVTIATGKSFQGTLSTKNETGYVDQKDQLAKAIIAICGFGAIYNMYQADRAEALAALDKVDYTLYSSTAVEKNSKKTYLVLAQEAIADAKEAVKTYNNDMLKDYKSDVVDGLATKLNGVKAFVGKIVVATKYDDNTTLTGLYKINSATKETVIDGFEVDYTNIKTIKELDNASKIDEATKASLKAYAKAQAVSISDSTKAAAFITVYDYLIDNDVVTANGQIDQTSADFTTVVGNIDDLKAYAAKYKAEKDANGEFVRDAEAVDKIVEKATLYAYAKAEDSTYAGTAYTIETAKADIVKEVKATVAEKLAEDKALAKAALDAKLADIAEDYYALEMDAIKANYNKFVATIDAAEKQADFANCTPVNMLTKDGKGVTAIKTIEQVDSALAWGAKEPAGIVLADAKTLIAYKNNKLTYLDSNFIVSYDDALKKIIAPIYGEAGARTTTELKNVKIDVEKVVAELSTVGSLAAAKKTAVDAIKALPAKSAITVADKDAVENAFNLKAAYDKMNGHETLAEASTLDNAIKALFDAMQYDLAVKVAKISKTDKAALKALKAELDEANALVDADKVFASKVTTPATAKFDAGKVVLNALRNIRADEMKAVIKAIDALPLNISKDDVAAVEAASKSYAAFVAEYATTTADNLYEDIFAPTKQASLVAARATLAKAEKAAADVKDVTKYGDKDAKADLLDMNRKVTIWRTSKKSIRVTAVGSVSNIKENGYTVKYTFYKKAPGAKSYKAIRTTTSNKYTYTNLKKGYNKFQVKVSVYNAEGKLVASKTTFYRAAKVK